MNERKMMTLSIETTDENHSWIVGRISGMISAIANGGRSFYMNEGYGLEHRTLDKNAGEFYRLFADVTREEFDKIFTMLDRSYGDHKLINYTVECDW